VRWSGGASEPAFAISLLQSVTEVLGTKSVSEIAIQTAEYDGSPLSLALQKLEDTYLKHSQACLLVFYDTQPPLQHTLISLFYIEPFVPDKSHRCMTSTTVHELADAKIQNCDWLNSVLLQQMFKSGRDKLWAFVVQEERERPYKSMEQRMAAYRQECEARLQQEVHRQASPLFLCIY
jgi:hypothetical protein